MTWRCRQHGEDCNSYVIGIIKELNEGKKVDEQFMKLVEYVKEDGTVRKHICLNCKKEMYEVWDSIAKCYNGYGWSCECMPKDMKLGLL